MDADVLVSNQGSIFLFTLQTPAAREFVDAHVPLESYQWVGGDSFAVEWRYARDLANGMMEDGLSVE